MSGEPGWRRVFSAGATYPAPGDLIRAGLQALNDEAFEQVVARFRPELSGRLAGEAKAWQIAALAWRGLQDSPAAHRAFMRAAELAPDDPLIAHGLARAALEGGEPATALFNRAYALAPHDGSVVLGRSAAQLAAGECGAATQDLLRVLEKSPLWIEGHLAFARLAATAGVDRFASLHRAIAAQPHVAELRLAVVQVSMQAGDYAGASRAVAAAVDVFGDAQELTRLEAICLSEAGDATRAQALFEQLPQAELGHTLVPVLRNLIRLGRYDEALAVARPTRDPGTELHLWPYRALLWRILGDALWEWLEGEPKLIGEYELGLNQTDMAELRALLQSLHRKSGQPLDQSVRGGSQTDGNLLARGEPVVRRLRSAVLDAVATHIAGLPPPRAGHPSLPVGRGPIRVAGAWSVRLTGSGFHVDHVHQQGWLSSAFYVALPPASRAIEGGAHGDEGWLAFGQCRDLVPELEAFRLVEPREGTLVLFPSTMWHGTRPFTHGERLTVALDIAYPFGERPS